MDDNGCSNRKSTQWAVERDWYVFVSASPVAGRNAPKKSLYRAARKRSPAWHAVQVVAVRRGPTIARDNSWPPPAQSHPGKSLCSFQAGWCSAFQGALFWANSGSTRSPNQVSCVWGAQALGDQKLVNSAPLEGDLLLLIEVSFQPIQPPTGAGLLQACGGHARPPQSHPRLVRSETSHGGLSGPSPVTPRAQRCGSA
jgi:hypothetical protein